MVCLWHTMLVNNWEELKSSNYIGLLMETAILLLWHVVAGIVALARSAALMEVELSCGTTEGFTPSLTFWAGLRFKVCGASRPGGRTGLETEALPAHPTPPACWDSFPGILLALPLQGGVFTVPAWHANSSGNGQTPKAPFPTLPGADISTLPSSHKSKQPLHLKIQLVAKETI